MSTATYRNPQENLHASVRSRSSQRFGSAANLNIQLHCLVLDGIYHIQDGVPAFHSVRTPMSEQLQGLLSRSSNAS